MQKHPEFTVNWDGEREARRIVGAELLNTTIPEKPLRLVKTIVSATIAPHGTVTEVGLVERLKSAD